MTAVELPDKSIFSIGEVAKIVSLPTYVIRYWETRVPALKPARRESKQRRYTQRDIELIMKIKELVHVRRYSVEGAKKVLSQDTRRKSQQPMLELEREGAATSLLRQVKKELKEILKTG